MSRIKSTGCPPDRIAECHYIYGANLPICIHYSEYQAKDIVVISDEESQVGSRRQCGPQSVVYSAPYGQLESNPCVLAFVST
jgi:hypothetical protein